MTEGISLLSLKSQNPTPKNLEEIKAKITKGIVFIDSSNPVTTPSNDSNVQHHKSILKNAMKKPPINTGSSWKIQPENPTSSSLVQ